MLPEPMRAPGQRQLGPAPLLLGATSQVKCLQTVVPLCPVLLSPVCMLSPSALAAIGHFYSWEGLCCFSVLLSREAAACITAVGLQSHSSVSKGTFPKCLHLALLPRGHFLLSRTKRRDCFLSWCPLLFPVSQELVWMSRFIPSCLLLPAHV